MKLIYTMLRNATLLIALLSVGYVNAQSNFGEIRGKVIDAVTKSPVEFATIRLEQNGRYVSGVAADIEGSFQFKTLTPGEYDIVVTSVGSQDTARLSVLVSADGIVRREITLGGGRTLKIADVKGTKRLIEVGETVNVVSEKEIKQLPTRNLGDIAALQRGVNRTASGGVSFRGSRTDGTAYFIDGVRAIGSVGMTQAAQGQINVYQNGVPAQFGDFTGGAISVTTRGASRFHQGSVEFISSTPTEFFKLTGDRFENDNRFRRENRFDFNQIEAFASGPLWIKNKNQKNIERVVLGYMIAGNMNYNRDPSPSFIGVYKVKEDVLREIERNPLVANIDGGFVHAGNYLTRNDLENVRVRPNSSQWGGNLQGKIDYMPSKNSDLSFYSSLQQGDGFAVNNNIMNYDLNGRNNSYTIRSYLRFTQRLPESVDTLGTKGKKTTLSNAFFTVRLDYQNTITGAFDQFHRDRIFDYGYIGKFDRYQTESFTYYGDPTNPDVPAKRFIDQNGDTVLLRNYWEQNGFRDTAYKFTRASDFMDRDINPLRGNYTSNLYNLLGEQGFTPSNEFQVQQLQGLLNGFNPPNVYSIWATPGFISSNFSKSQAERYTFYAMAEAQLRGPNRGDKKATPHDLQFGLQYEQTINRGWGLNAAGLWRLMPLLMNSHISELDRSNPIVAYDENGVFQDTVRFNRFVNTAAQTNFDKNFREKLIKDGRKDIKGNTVDDKTFVEVNSFTPDDFRLEMFNANELLNNGSSFVSYYGYDHLGNIVRGRPSVEDFTNDPDKRALGAFMPVYAAAWVQDKFAFKDVIFRLGLRLERYDANQLVLKDPYSLYPVKTVGEVSDINGNNISHPNNMGDDYKVYVNDVNSPTKVIGYRNGDQWYDAGGNELSSPEALANQTNSGRIAPYLVDPSNQQITRNSFQDFDPKINVLPRVYFAFPIREEASFYASFDVLAQRPLAGASFMTIDNYYYMDQRNAGALANPALKPRIKTEYQIGFKQMLGDNSALTIDAYYSEIKNDIQLFQYSQAYPITYISYQNIDFSTVKGFSGEYQFRNNNISITTNYTLQFADGTGSNPNAAAALIASNQPNLRTMFPLGELDIRHQARVIFNYDFGFYNKLTKKSTYAGPVWGEKVFQNVNANFVFSANSGLPYTATNVPTQIGSADRANIKGTPFGSRLPWQYNVDFNISKTAVIKRGKDAEGVERKPIQANIFLWVTNVFNFQNVRGVYSYTGQPDDDGFINSPRGQQAVSEQLSAQAYTDLYRILVNSPNNYQAPRFARLGVRFMF